MKFKEFSKYLGLFILGVLLIAVYKTFDNFSSIWSLAKKIFAALTPFLYGAGIAFLLYTPCQKLEKLLIKSKLSFVRTHRRGISVGISFVLLALILAGIFWLIVPTLAKSLLDLVGQLPVLWQQILAWAHNLEGWGIPAEELLPSISVSAIMEHVEFSNVSQYAEGVWAAGTSVFNFIMSVIISVYILLDRSHIKTAVTRLTNNFIPKEKQQKNFYKYTNRAFRYMNAYVYCKLIDTVIIGVVSFLILLPFGAPYAPLLALMLGLFNLIPYFGAIVACIISSLLTMALVSPARGIWVLVVLIVLQQIDANVIQPKLVNETMDIKPLWVIFSILLFGALFGIWGILLGVPVMALILSAVEDALHLREERKAELARKVTQSVEDETV